MVDSLLSQIENKKNELKLRKVILKWKDFLREKKLEKQLNHMAVKHHENKLLKKCYNSWQNQVNSQKTERIKLNCQNRAEQILQLQENNYQSKIKDLNDEILSLKNKIQHLENDNQKYQHNVNLAFNSAQQQLSKLQKSILQPSNQQQNNINNITTTQNSSSSVSSSINLLNKNDQNNNLSINAANNIPFPSSKSLNIKLNYNDNSNLATTTNSSDDSALMTNSSSGYSSSLNTLQKQQQLHQQRKRDSAEGKPTRPTMMINIRQQNNDILDSFKNLSNDTPENFYKNKGFPNFTDKYNFMNDKNINLPKNPSKNITDHNNVLGSSTSAFSNLKSSNNKNKSNQVQNANLPTNNYSTKNHYNSMNQNHTSSTSLHNNNDKSKRNLQKIDGHTLNKKSMFNVEMFKVERNYIRDFNHDNQEDNDDDDDKDNISNKAQINYSHPLKDYSMYKMTSLASSLINSATTHDSMLDDSNSTDRSLNKDENSIPKDLSRLDRRDYIKRQNHENQKQHQSKHKQNSSSQKNKKSSTYNNNNTFDINEYKLEYVNKLKPREDVAEGMDGITNTSSLNLAELTESRNLLKTLKNKHIDKVLPNPLGIKNLKN